MLLTKDCSENKAVVLRWCVSTCCLKFRKRILELKQVLKLSVQYVLYQWSVKFLSSESSGSLQKRET